MRRDQSTVQEENKPQKQPYSERYFSGDSQRGQAHHDERDWASMNQQVKGTVTQRDGQRFSGRTTFRVNHYDGRILMLSDQEHEAFITPAVQEATRNGERSNEGDVH